MAKSPSNVTAADKAKAIAESVKGTAAGAADAAKSIAPTAAGEKVDAGAAAAAPVTPAPQNQ
jgi:hypothetical protein